MASPLLSKTFPCLSFKGYFDIFYLFLTSLIFPEKPKDTLLVGGTEIDDCNWYATKEVLRKSFKGRSVVEWVENHLNTQSKKYMSFIR